MKIYDPSKFKKLPSLILFDTDNTLYSYKNPHMAGMEAVKNKVTSLFSISERDFEQSFLRSRDEVKSRLGPAAASHSRLLYMQRMLEILGLGSQVLMALDLEQTYWRTFLGKANLFEDVKELLDDLRLLDVRAVVVTDLTAQIQFRKLVYFGLENSFDYVVTSEEAGFDKPHKAPFELALEKTGLCEGIVWMIGDNTINDILGAREALDAVTLQKLHDDLKVDSDNCCPDASFRSFSEIRELIAKMVKRNGS